MNNKVILNSYDEFWKFYLGEHSSRVNRRLHFIGTSLAILLLGVALARASVGLAFIAIIQGYGLAWVGHFFVEKNKPASFSYPYWSFISDWRMWALMLMRKPLN